MKIGILTFHRAINYGAVLQTYALQTSIEKLHVTNEVIDYRCKKIEEMYQPFFNAKSFSTWIKCLLRSPKIRKKTQKFYSFRDRYIKTGVRPYLSSEEMSEINKEYDCFVVGSDQVWNKDCTGFDNTYFLNFVQEDEKKNSYAASFGTDQVSAKCVDEYTRLLENFRYISVREHQGQAIVKELLHREASIEIDPTFLLTQEEWKRMATRPIDGNYILLYLMQSSGSLLHFAEDLSKKTGLKICYICDNLKKPIRAEYLRAVGPEEFVGLFASASYVVTNSFHGTVFSIIMNKNFFLQLQAPGSANARLENIMDTYNLRTRQIVNGKNDYLDQEVDYGPIDEQIMIERKKSMDYLKKVTKSL
jgi:hypothetical protein